MRRSTAPCGHHLVTIGQAGFRLDKASCPYVNARGVSAPGEKSMKMTRVAKVAIATMALGVGCSDRQVQTELVPEGPPEIKQVFMNARVTLEGGSQRTMNQLAYGSHPDINDDTSID